MIVRTKKEVLKTQLDEDSSMRYDMIGKPCSKCRNILTEENSSGTKLYCRSCSTEYGREYYKKHREKIKAQLRASYQRHKSKNHTYGKIYRNSERGLDRSLRYKFGISYQEYTKMEIEQNGVCAICKKTQKEKSVRNKRLTVDHSHTTGKIRGLLCDFCNRGLGLFKDDIVYLKNAISYLETRDVTCEI